MPQLALEPCAKSNRCCFFAWRALDRGASVSHMPVAWSEASVKMRVGLPGIEPVVSKHCASWRSVGFTGHDVIADGPLSEVSARVNAERASVGGTYEGVPVTLRCDEVVEWARDHGSEIAPNEP